MADEADYANDYADRWTEEMIRKQRERSSERIDPDVPITPRDCADCGFDIEIEFLRRKPRTPVCEECEGYRKQESRMRGLAG